MRYSAVFGEKVNSGDYTMRCKNVVERKIVQMIDQSFRDVMQEKNCGIKDCIVKHSLDVVHTIRNGIALLQEENALNKIQNIYCVQMQSVEWVYDETEKRKVKVGDFYSIAMCFTYLISTGPKAYSKSFSEVIYL
jgi:hypothetical protein